MLGNVEEVCFYWSSREFLATYLFFQIRLNPEVSASRDKLVNHLKENGIGVSIHYATPVPQLSYYKKNNRETFPNAEYIADCSISLPVAPHIRGEDVIRLAKCVKSFFRERGR